MVKNGAKNVAVAAHTIKKILITQPRPETDKSPYFELAKKYSVELDFHPFIRVEGMPAKDFRKQKVEITQYTKYCCITEAVALYLQKFILYRKRKVFYGADGLNKSMFDVINKHKENERFLYPCSENQQDNEIVNWLKANNCGFATPFMYRTISNDVKDVMVKNEYDIICFFTPSGVRSLLDNFPKFQQNGTRIGAFGNNTSKAVEDAGLTLDIKAPQPQATSMVAALEMYLSALTKKK